MFKRVKNRLNLHNLDIRNIVWNVYDLCGPKLLMVDVLMGREFVLNH